MNTLYKLKGEEIRSSKKLSSLPGIDLPLAPPAGLETLVISSMCCILHFSDYFDTLHSDIVANYN